MESAWRARADHRRTQGDPSGRRGAGSNIADEEYVAQGARIAPDALLVFKDAELIVKVKEPQSSAIAMLRPDHILFGYLHLAPDPEQAQGLTESGTSCLAYETGRTAPGSCPCSRRCPPWPADRGL